MNLPEHVLTAVHVAATLAVVLGIALLGRLAASALRQPQVIGEIAAGLLAGPALVAALGSGTFGQLLPSDVLAALKVVAEVGLVLFLLGLTHESQRGPDGRTRTQIGRVAFAGLVPCLALGALYGGWVLLTQDSAVRGAAPPAAVVVFLAVAMSVSAVPVLARITADRSISQTSYGRLALAAAMVMDAAGWVLLSLAVALSSGSFVGFVHTLAVLTAGVLAAVGTRRLLRSPAATAVAVRRPGSTAVQLGAAALAAAFGAERLGLSVIFGAVVVGVAIPAGDDSWSAVVASVSRVGRPLVPAFFVVTGVTVLTGQLSSPPWPAIVLVVTLGALGKVGGGYFGALLAGESTLSAVRVGVLLNTRGLTELLALQVGYRAHILSAPLYLAFIVMALVTTALTGPLLTLLDRVSAPRYRVPPA